MSDVAEQMVVEEGSIRSSVDTQGRRKRQRQRRKRKIARPPYEPRRAKKGQTASVRAQEIRNEMFTNGQPVAPYNTTQFLIEDHGDLHNIDAQLSKAPDSHRHSRTRDSSFSIDSDDEFFYSSPEDEEEFLTKEFSLEYQDLHVERLNSLPKVDIIRDYLVLESKYEKSVVELRKLKTDSGRDTDASSKSDADVNEQLRLAHLENRRLKAELEKVKRENAQLESLRNRSDDSSVDSESDSSTSSSSSVHSNSDSDPPSPQCADSPPETANEPAIPECETADGPAVAVAVEAVGGQPAPPVEAVGGEPAAPVEAVIVNMPEEAEAIGAAAGNVADNIVEIEN